MVANNTTIVYLNMTNPLKASNAQSRPTANPQPTAKESTKQLHVNISAPLHKKFRLRVLEEGRSMNQVIEELILNYVGE
jgi:hypothetical protein